MAPEDVRRPDRSERTRRAVLQPSQDIGGSDEDDNDLQARITGEHAVEDEVERLRPDTGAGDTAHMDFRRSEPEELLRPVERALKCPGPGRVLIQKKPFRLTPTGHEHSIQSGDRAWYFVTTLAVAVDIEPRFPLQLRKNL